jgi:hypothetical protein
MYVLDGDLAMLQLGGINAAPFGDYVPGFAVACH